MKKNKIIPIPGQLFVECDTNLKEVEGDIIIPDVALSEMGYTGTVIAESPRPQDPRGFVGRKVLIHTGIGQDFEYQDVKYRRVPLDVDCIIAVVYEGKWVTLKEATGRVRIGGEIGIKRCRFCKSKGRTNILLTHGYCPVCKKFPGGKIKKKPEVIEDDRGNIKVMHVDKVSDEEKELYGGTDGPKKARGMGISYPRQQRRS